MRDADTYHCLHCGKKITPCLSPVDTSKEWTNICSFHCLSLYRLNQGKGNFFPINIRSTIPDLDRALNWLFLGDVEEMRKTTIDMPVIKLLEVVSLNNNLKKRIERKQKNVSKTQNRKNDRNAIRY